MAIAKIIFSTEDTISDGVLSLESKSLSQARITVTELSEDSLSDSESSTSSTPALSPPGIHGFGAEAEYFRLSFEVLNVLEQYGTHVGHENPTADGGPAIWSGKLRFLPHVYHHISRSKPVQLTMPAFPCKSVSGSGSTRGLAL
jgi:hypothetical protein